MLDWDFIWATVSLMHNIFHQNLKYNKSYKQRGICKEFNLYT